MKYQINYLKDIQLTTQKKMSKSRLLWVDILKIVACTMVMVFHFSYASILESKRIDELFGPNLVILFKTFLNPLMNGTLWVFVFCTLSGFLASSRIINSFRELLICSIKRYCRLLFPILITFLVVYFVSKYDLFTNVDYGKLTNNDWIAHFYTRKYDFFELLFAAFVFDSEYLAPLWMLKYLFWGNLLISLNNYLRSKSGGGAIACIADFIIFCVIFYYCKFDVLFVIATIAGNTIKRYGQNTLKTSVSLFCLIIMVIAYYILNISGLMNSIASSSFLLFFMGMAIVLFISNLKVRMKKTKNIAFEINVGSITFWVYLLHWVIICSLSCKILLLFKNNLSLGLWVSMLVTVLAVYFVSFLLSLVFDFIIPKLKKE